MFVLRHSHSFTILCMLITITGVHADERQIASDPGNPHSIPPGCQHQYVDCEYNLNGTLTEYRFDGMYHVLTHDALNRVIHMEISDPDTGVTAVHHFSHLGDSMIVHRKIDASGSTTDRYIGSGGDVSLIDSDTAGASEFVDSGAAGVFRVLDSSMGSQIDQLTVDPFNNVIAEINSAGQTVRSIRYPPFGEAFHDSPDDLTQDNTPLDIASVHDNLLFLKRPYLIDVELYRIGARFYDARREVFSKYDEKQAMDNLYAYYRNPFSGIDPTGYSPQNPHDEQEPSWQDLLKDMGWEFGPASVTELAFIDGIPMVRRDGGWAKANSCIDCHWSEPMFRKNEHEFRALGMALTAAGRDAAPVVAAAGVTAAVLLIPVSGGTSLVLLSAAAGAAGGVAGNATDQWIQHGGIVDTEELAFHGIVGGATGGLVSGTGMLIIGQLEKNALVKIAQQETANIYLVDSVALARTPMVGLTDDALNVFNRAPSSENIYGMAQLLDNEFSSAYVAGVMDSGNGAVHLAWAPGFRHGMHQTIAADARMLTGPGGMSRGFGVIKNPDGSLAINFRSNTNHTTPGASQATQGWDDAMSIIQALQKQLQSGQ